MMAGGGIFKNTRSRDDPALAPALSYMHDYLGYATETLRTSIDGEGASKSDSDSLHAKLKFVEDCAYQAPRDGGPGDGHALERVHRRVREGQDPGLSIPVVALDETLAEADAGIGSPAGGKGKGKGRSKPEGSAGAVA
ncbi:hypothetical protein CYMTET_56502 [Cymbomonas tetramitiformis]|uniref:Uncharacterized protein n=1 Tax=Cymbomonas tetramitiformis TaxID=36881 RepID=A0AAE0EM94_9CHLO|nr:hypothetical protein CYMTET_56502 [Cymbomonas tetramitiformis]